MDGLKDSVHGTWRITTLANEPLEESTDGKFHLNPCRDVSERHILSSLLLIRSCSGSHIRRSLVTMWLTHIITKIRMVFSVYFIFFCFGFLVTEL